MSSSQDHIDRFSKKLITYAVLYQTCSDRVRELGYNEKIYDKANEEWQSDSSNPLFEPPVNDAEKRAAFFAKCDEICQSKPKTAIDYCKISFACWAGMQIINNQELANLPAHIIGNVHRLAAAEYIKQNPNVPVLPDSPDDMNPKLPAHLVAAIFPNSTRREVVKGTKIGAHLINQTIPFIDQETGKIFACTIHDYGTSHIRGEWYEVTYGGKAEPHIISSVELEEIITNRVQEDID